MNNIDITLITTSHSQVSLGMRYLASYLKSKQFKVRLIFFPPDRLNQDFNPALLEQLKSLLSDTRFIGLSMMTMDSSSSIKLTKYLKETQTAPIVWGGIHPTLCPDEALEHADIVCIGEGEETLLELLQKSRDGRDICDIKGLYIKNTSKGITKNELRFLLHNLDDYPPPDYSGNEHWIIKDGKFMETDESYLRNFFKSNSFIIPQDNKVIYTFTAMSSRGCPFKCNYCSNALFLDKFKGKGTVVRRKSVNFFINELKGVLNHYSYINFFNIYDDDFLFGKFDYVEEFSERYKIEVGLPFHCLAAPQSITEDKIKAIAYAGCKTLQVGIQSGSERVNKEVYNRRTSNNVILNSVKLINKYKKNILPRYDFMVDNPYETKSDKLETLKLISKVPKPFRLQIFSMVFYPHTVLFDKAQKDNLLSPESLGTVKQMSKFNNLSKVSYFTLVLSISPYLPNSLYNFLISDKIFYFFESTYFNNFFEQILKMLVLINRKMKLNIYKLVIKNI